VRVWCIFASDENAGVTHGQSLWGDRSGELQEIFQRKRAPLLHQYPPLIPRLHSSRLEHLKWV
jgi:hypothetical protein